MLHDRMKGDTPTTTNLGPREMLSLLVRLEEKSLLEKDSAGSWVALSPRRGSTVDSADRH